MLWQLLCHNGFVDFEFLMIDEKMAGRKEKGKERSKKSHFSATSSIE